MKSSILRRFAMFQPSGLSRPDSWCKGYPFYPPKNTDDAIQYLDYRSHYERKEQWPTSKIRRAVVTYRLSAKVQKTKAYIIEKGQKLVVPNTLAITRNRNEDIEEILDNVHYKSVGGKRNINELESYEDVNIGRVVFNRTNLPRHKCEEYRSIAKIDNGELLQSKLERFAIYKYVKDEEQVAITLNQNIQTCGKVLYQTGIPDVYVVLIEESEEFLENEN